MGQTRRDKKRKIALHIESRIILGAGEARAMPAVIGPNSICCWATFLIVPATVQIEGDRHVR